MTQPKRESEIQREIHLGAIDDDTRLFRNNVARAWVGQIVGRTADTITLRNPRPLHAGLAVGSGDLIGWRTERHPTGPVARFVSIEIKSSTGAVRSDQSRWHDAVTRAGGLSIIARSLEDIPWISTRS